MRKISVFSDIEKEYFKVSFKIIFDIVCQYSLKAAKLKSNLAVFRISWQSIQHISETWDNI